MTWSLRTRGLDLDRPRLIGIVNVTPDSFSDGGRFASTSAAIDHGRSLVEEGADLVDVGGESTRPGARPVPAEEEIGRVVPVVEALAGDGIVVSVDTSKPEVALAAVQVGAEVINDVSGFRQPGMRRVAAETGAGLVVMHMQGTPADMQDDPAYADVVEDVAGYLAAQADLLESEGVAASRIVVDPGIGFGKKLNHNLALLAGLDTVGGGRPVVLGASRKSFLKTLLGVDDPADRDRASAVVVALGVARGVRLFRVHDVEASLEAARLSWAIVREER